MKLFAKKEKPERALFASYGWPEMPLDPCALRDFFLSAYSPGRTPSRLVALSSRWRAPMASAGADPRPQLIRDFNQSDPRLERVDYAPPGDPELAAKIRALMVGGGLSCKLDLRRGLDCSIWGPLLLALPEANVSICPLSLAEAGGAEAFFRAGRALRELRHQGVGIISCGQPFGREPASRAAMDSPGGVRLDELMSECCAILESARRPAEMMAPLKSVLESSTAIGASSAAGFLPLFFHLGLSFEGETGSLAHRSVAYGAFGNLCHWIGE